MKLLFSLDTWQEIYYSLRNNKLRTFLTMIGVGWGMFLYVSLLGAAKGVENGFNKAFNGFATNSILCGHKALLFLMEDFQKEN